MKTTRPVSVILLSAYLLGSPQMVAFAPESLKGALHGFHTDVNHVAQTGLMAADRLSAADPRDLSIFFALFQGVSRDLGNLGG